MNVNKSSKANADGKRGKPLYTLFVVSLIAAFVIAVLPMGSASAAPTGPGGSGSDKDDSWEIKVKTCGQKSRSQRTCRPSLVISAGLRTGKIQG